MGRGTRTYTHLYSIGTYCRETCRLRLQMVRCKTRWAMFDVGNNVGRGRFVCLWATTKADNRVGSAWSNAVACSDQDCQGTAWGSMRHMIAKPSDVLLKQSNTETLSDRAQTAVCKDGMFGGHAQLMMLMFAACSSALVQAACSERHNDNLAAELAPEDAVEVINVKLPRLRLCKQCIPCGCDVTSLHSPPRVRGCVSVRCRLPGQKHSATRNYKRD